MLKPSDVEKRNSDKIFMSRLKSEAQEIGKESSAGAALKGLKSSFPGLVEALKRNYPNANDQDLLRRAKEKLKPIYQKAENKLMYTNEACNPDTRAVEAETRRIFRTETDY